MAAFAYLLIHYEDKLAGWKVCTFLDNLQFYATPNFVQRAAKHGKNMGQSAGLIYTMKV